MTSEEVGVKVTSDRMLKSLWLLKNMHSVKPRKTLKLYVTFLLFLNFFSLLFSEKEIQCSHSKLFRDVGLFH